MHIPTTLSLTSARKNRKQKLQQRFPSVNFILIMLLHMRFFTEAILLCAVQNQGITSSIYKPPLNVSRQTRGKGGNYRLLKMMNQA